MISYGTESKKMSDRDGNAGHLDFISLCSSTYSELASKGIRYSDVNTN